MKKHSFYPTPLVRITVLVTQKQLADLRKLCNKEKMPMARVARLAIGDYLMANK